MHIKFGKARARGSGDILANRHTDRQTERKQTYSSQYFATAPMDEVKTVYTVGQLTNYKYFTLSYG